MIIEHDIMVVIEHELMFPKDK